MDLLIIFKRKNYWKSWDLVQKSQTCEEGGAHLTYFLLAFIDELWKTRKFRILKKWKNIAGDIIILHMCTKNHNHMRYSSWDTEWDKFVLSFWTILCPSTLPPPTPFHCNNSENQNFEKMKKASGDVIILNLCNKKHNHMMYAYSDMECNRHSSLSF